MWQRMDTWEVGHFDIFFRAVEDQRKRVDYCPTDLDPKTGESVIDVLRSKHPEARIPEADHFDEYQDEPNDVGIFCF